jgi:hypothetical protein
VCLNADAADAFSVLYHRGRSHLATHMLWLNESSALYDALRGFPRLEDLIQAYVCIVDLHTGADAAARGMPDTRTTGKSCKYCCHQRHPTNTTQPRAN